MPTLHLTFGQLTCHVVAHASRKPRLLVMLCHGFGAQGTDLLGLEGPLSRHLGARAADVAFVFPEAPLSLAPMTMPGRAWWMIDIARLMSPAGAKAGLEKMRAAAPEGLGQARKKLRDSLAHALQHFGLDYKHCVLGGFSQGAMLSTEVALRLEEAPAALMILSGTLIDEPHWRRLAPMRAGLHVVQSHGTQDPILPFSAAEDLRDLLTSAGLIVDFDSFDDGHTIDAGMLARMATRLHHLLDEMGTAPPSPPLP